MGLDINSYKRLHPADESELEFADDGELLNWESYVQIKPLAEMHEEYWPGRSAPYADEDAAEYYSFEDTAYMRAGSYAGYNMWRDILIDFVKREQLPANTFEELIEFSDCEGLIGSFVSEKLYHDFADNRQLLDDFADGYFSDNENRDWFVEKYDEWTEMFDLARDNGAVEFC